MIGAGTERRPRDPEEIAMIMIVVRWPVRPEHADAWPRITQDFTAATRAEDGNLFFHWSRDVADPTVYWLVEGFREDAAEAHVSSDHFRTAQEQLPPYLVETPTVRNMQIPGDGWDELGEFQVGS